MTTHLRTFLKIGLLAVLSLLAAIAEAQPLQITTASPLPAGTVGTSYSVTFTSTGGGSGPTRSWSTESAPPGLSLTQAGLLTGTPTTAGTFTFLVEVADEVENFDTKEFSLTINPRPPLSIITQALPQGIAGSPYSATVVATGGAAPYTWAVVAGVLPSGLGLNSGNGSISGFLSAPGTFSFTIRVTDSVQGFVNRNYTILVIPPLTITTASLSNAITGQAYSQSLAATGGAPPYQWLVNQGALPPGLVLNSTTGVISGTASNLGEFSFVLRVGDSAGSFAIRSFSIRVSPPPLAVTTETMPAGAIGVAYSTSLAATGGQLPYRWSVSLGTAPPGLALSPDGVLAGNPTRDGTFSFTVAVSDTLGSVATRAFSVRIDPPALRITTGSPLPEGTPGASYAAALAATGGTPPYSWAVAEGSLPGGVSLDSASGALSGTPAAEGRFSFTARVTDSAGRTASASFVIVAAPPLAIATSTFPDGVVGIAYLQGLAATGGTPPYNWAVSDGGLPAGLVLSASNGNVSGTPSAAGTFRFTIRVLDNRDRTATRELSITIRPALAITTTSLPAGEIGAQYAQSLAASGGTPPYSWSVAAGSLPNGVTLNSSTGALEGPPSSAGSFNFTIRVADAAGRAASRGFTIAVSLPQVPAVRIAGPPATPPPASQPGVNIQLAAAFPVELTGEVTLSFASDVPSGPPINDPAVQFSGGGRTASFRIPAGATAGVFTAPNLALQTGTVAGIITLTARLRSGDTDITPSPAPTLQIRVSRSAPSISAVRLTRTAQGFEVAVTGFSTPREVTQATFRFSPAAGGDLQTSEITVPVGSLFGGWFGGQASAAFGSQFLFTMPFTVQGDASAIGGVSVVLTNSLGASQASSASF